MKRIQRKRSKGWTMPPNTVYVGRPTKYGNPYIVSRKLGGGWVVLDRVWWKEKGWFETKKEAQEDACEEFFLDFGRMPLSEQDNILRELNGKDLACWCSLDEPCHADWLIEMCLDSVTLKG